MSRREPFFCGLPSTVTVRGAPERTILSALDVSLVLAIRALKAAHPSLEVADPVPTQPLLLLAESILASAAGLHELIAGYNELDERLAHLGGASARAQRVLPSLDSFPDDEDLPF